MAENTKQLIIEINEDLHRRFKDRVSTEGRTMKWVLTQYIRKYTYNKEPVDNRNQ